jgi:hypothetical protein
MWTGPRIDRSFHERKVDGYCGMGRQHIATIALRDWFCLVRRGHHRADVPLSPMPGYSAVALMSVALFAGCGEVSKLPAGADIAVGRASSSRCVRWCRR